MKTGSRQITTNDTGIGITVRNINLANGLSAEDTLQIQEWLNRYRVVIFPDQILSDGQLEEFAFRFGPAFTPDTKFPVLGSTDSAGPVVIVGNQAHEYTKSYLGHQEVLPHSDHQWLRSPSAVSTLYALDIRQNAAPTTWTDMVNAYGRLDSETAKAIHDLKVITYNPFYRAFGSVVSKYVDRLEDIPPGETFPHPLVRTHPLTHEKILYLNIAYEVEFVGIPYQKGVELFSMLCDHIKNSSCKYEHHWKNGDLVLWDNRATVHYRPAFNSDVRRVLKRITIGGEIPF